MKQEDSAENSGPKHSELKKIDTKCKSSFLIQQKKKKNSEQLVWKFLKPLSNSGNIID